VAGTTRADHPVPSAFSASPMGLCQRAASLGASLMNATPATMPNITTIQIILRTSN
jgi:hypothetical protein